MTMRRLGALQWFGLGGAALTWFAQLILGWGFTEGDCAPGGRGWTISNDTWQALLMSVGVVVALTGEAAAVRVWRATRGADYEGEPPDGRLQFFSTAALVANVVFLMIILLTGLAAIFNVACRQS